MMNQAMNIPCPTCNTPIPFDPGELMRGRQFVCPNCKAAIGLAQESQSTVEDAMDKFKEMKQNLKNKPE